MPNPFYQIYEGAARLSGAEPVFVNAGHNPVRMALVAPLDACIGAAQRIRTFTEPL